jgi:hypothetical protein
LIRGSTRFASKVAEIKKLEPKDVPTTLVMQENETNRTTQILIRGSHLNKGAEVTAGVPAVLHPLPPGEPASRLTFAHWLVDPANPLTGRVIMNRIWAQYFGRGPGGNERRVRGAGRSADSSGVVGLARHRVYPAGLELESDAPVNRHFGNVSPNLGGHA